MKLPVVPAIVAALLTWSAAAPSAAPRESMVVSVEQLASRLQDPDLVLLHVGDRAEYDRAHIPGARFVKTADLAVSDTGGQALHLEMPALDVLKARLEALGISDRSRIVVYYGQDWVSPATRIVFTLDYAGLGDRTALLDGGQGAWVGAGHPVTSEVPPVRTGSLSALAPRPSIVDRAFVRSHLDRPGFAVVDARDRAFYDGSRAGGPMDHPHRAGHIHGARSVPFSELTDQDLRLQTSEHLRDVFDRAGVKAGDTVVAYCHIGQQATAVVFAARLLGHEALLYDGSFEDWSRADDAAVDGPPK